MFTVKEWGESLPKKGEIFNAKTESGANSRLFISKIIHKLFEPVNKARTSVGNFLIEKISPKFKTYTETATKEILVEGLKYLAKEGIKFVINLFK